MSIYKILFLLIISFSLGNMASAELVQDSNGNYHYLTYTTASSTDVLITEFPGRYSCQAWKANNNYNFISDRCAGVSNITDSYDKEVGDFNQNPISDRHRCMSFEFSGDRTDRCYDTAEECLDRSLYCVIYDNCSSVDGDDLRCREPTASDTTIDGQGGLNEYTPPEPYTVDANLSNPITSDNVTTLLEKLYRGFIAIVVPILVLVLVYSGFIFVTAQGNEEKLKTAKRNAGYVVVGLIIILAAEVLIAVFKNLADAFGTL